MKIKRIFKRENGNSSTLLAWQHNGRTVELALDYDASAIYSEPMQLIFVEAFEQKKIFSYDLNANPKDFYNIPEKDGYEFRGLNKNVKSSSGVSLLYHPFRNDNGNQWNDTEQYEFVTDDNVIGKFLDIFR